MEETIGLVIAFMVISSFVLCILVFIFSSLGGFFNEYNSEREKEWQKRLAESKKADENAAKAHKVRTQYPQPKTNVTSFEITNIKESILVTETVYAD